MSFENELTGTFTFFQLLVATFFGVAPVAVTIAIKLVLYRRRVAEDETSSPQMNIKNNQTRDSIMKKPTIIITEGDYAQLSRMLDVDARSPREREAIEALEAELKHVAIVAPDDVPPDVITMNSRAELLDLNTGERMEFTVVFPSDANIDDGKISVLAPVGVGMLGYRVGDVFESPTPLSVRRLKVIEVSFQPEAALAAA